MKDEIIEWALSKHEKMVMVLPVADKDPWTLHGPETVCFGCSQIFVEGYLADIPVVFEILGQDDDEVSGI